MKLNDKVLRENFNLADIQTVYFWITYKFQKFKS